MTDITRLDALTLAAAIRRGALSAVEAVTAALAAIDRLNPRLLAFCTPTPELALAQAKAVDAAIAAGEPTGPLAGVPMGIKDLIFTRGIRTTGGSRLYQDFVPEEEDVAVERLRRAGAVILGKTNVAELGYSLSGDNPLFGTTRNPWKLSLSAGGSSAGAAAAVAAGLGPIGLGSDGGGSIRVPAAFCGLYGFKPSMGRVPLYPGCRDERWPGLAGWESLEHIGPLSRTVADAALTLSVIAGPDGRDRRSIPAEIADWLGVLDGGIAGLRIGYWRAVPDIAVDPAIDRITAEAVEVFATELGGIVEDITPSWGNPVLPFRGLIALDSDLVGLRAMAAHHPVPLSPPLRRLLQQEWTATQFTDALRARKAVANAMWRLMERFDLLVTPTTSAPAPPAEKSADADDVERPLPVFTCIANMTGQPAASIPAGWTADGLPVGLQIIGPHLGDALVLRASAAFERARPWRARWPAL